MALVAYIGAREVIAHHDDGSVVRYGIDDTVVGDPVLPDSPARWPIFLPLARASVRGERQ